MLPLRTHSPEAAAKFINGRARLHRIRQRERDRNLLTLSELLADDQWVKATDDELAAEVGVSRWTIIQYKKTLVERGRCPACGQLRPTAAHLEKSQQALPPPPK